MLTRDDQLDLMEAVSIAIVSANGIRLDAMRSMNYAFLSGRLISLDLFVGSLSRAHTAHVEAEDWARLLKRLYTVRTSEGLARP